jgi:hypothetical protein
MQNWSSILRYLVFLVLAWNVLTYLGFHWERLHNVSTGLYSLRVEIFLEMRGEEQQESCERVCPRQGQNSQYTFGYDKGKFEDEIQKFMTGCRKFQYHSRKGRVSQRVAANYQCSEYGRRCIAWETPATKANLRMRFDILWRSAAGAWTTLSFYWVEFLFCPERMHAASSTIFLYTANCTGDILIN